MAGTTTPPQLKESWPGSLSGGASGACLARGGDVSCATQGSDDSEQTKEDKDEEGTGRRN
jgi:hypothetical protein